MLVFSTFLSNLSLKKKKKHFCVMFIKKKKVSEHGINHPKNHAPFFTWWSPSEGRGKKT